jgi:serine protease Do
MRRCDLLKAVVVLLACVGWVRAGAQVLATRPTTAPSAAAPVKPVPENVRDLRALQARVRAVVEKVSPAVVGLRVGGQGSGVIISEDGYVLTAGHVASAPGRDVTLILSNGKFVRAKSLGVNYGVDSGLVKIVEPPPEGGKWPVAEMGKSSGLQKGQWCIALGHPGGYKFGRTPPLRLGRILDTRGTFVRTDCTLVGGDSGGPLFDLDGRVIAIHSRIGNSLNDNMHVPIDTYHETWERLARGDAWGQPSSFLAVRPGGPYLGIVPPKVDAAASANECRIGSVEPKSPAEAVGLRAGDVITRFEGQRIGNWGELWIYLARQRAGEEVPIEVRRGDETLKFKLTVGRRPAATQPQARPQTQPRPPAQPGQ